MLMRKYPMGVLICLFILGWPLLFLCVYTFALGLRNQGLYSPGTCRSIFFVMSIVTNLIESGTALVWQIRREIKNIREDDMAQDNYMTWPSLAVDFAAGVFSTYVAVCTFIRSQRGQYEFSDGSAYDLMGIVAGPVFAVTAVVYAVQKALLRRRLSRGHAGEKGS